jgi:hypothetical protein
VTTGIVFLIFFIPFSYILDEKPFRKLQWNRFLLFSLLLGAISYLLVDIEPQPQHYSIADLQREATQTGNAAFLSKSFFSGEVEQPAWVSEMKENPQLLQGVDNYEELIRKSWRRIRTQRLVIDQLVVLENFPQPGLEYIERGEVKNIEWLRDIASIYQGYILLSSRQGDLETALKELRNIQLLARKGFAGAILPLDKLIWGDVLNTNLTTAYQLVEEFDLAGYDLERIAGLFTSLSNEEISLKKPWIGKYLAAKSQINEGAKLMEGLVPSPSFIPTDLKVVETIFPYLYEGLYQLTFRKNMTDKLVDDTFLPLIKDAEKGAVVSAETWEQVDVLSRKPTVRNLAGWYLFRSPGSVKYGNEVVQLKVRSDLLAIFINKKLGNVEVIPDYFSGEDNKMKMIYRNLVSAGKDTVYDTDDDISLKILY